MNTEAKGLLDEYVWAGYGDKAAADHAFALLHALPPASRDLLLTRLRPTAAVHRLSVNAVAARGLLAGEIVLRARDLAAGLPACRGCGCTQNAACVGGCSWAEPDLCTRCTTPAWKTAGAEPAPSAPEAA